MKLLKKLDFIGNKPNFKLNKHNHYQTYFGAFASVLVIFLNFAITRSTFFNFFENTFPSMSQSYSTNDNRLYFNLQNNSFLMFNYNYVNTANISRHPIHYNETIIPPIVIVSDLLDESNTYFDKPSVLLERCTNMITKESFPNYENDKEYYDNILSIASFSYCMPSNDNLYTSLNSKSYGQLLTVSILKQADTTLRSLYPDKLLGLLMYYEKRYINQDTTKKDQFFIKKLEYEYFPFSNEENKISIYNLFFEKVQYIRDYSLFLFYGTINEDNFHSLQKNVFNGNTKSSNTQITSLFIMLNKSTLSRVFNFQFTSLSDCLSAFGGTYEIIFILVETFYVFFFSFDYKAYLINSVFSFHAEDEESKQSARKVSAAFGNNINNFQSNTNRENKNTISELDRIVKGDGTTNRLPEISQIELKICLNKILLKRQPYSINSIDTLKAAFNQIRNKESEKDKLINLLDIVIQENIDFVKIIKNSLDIYALKETIIEKPLINFITFPSLNINNCSNSIKYINSFNMNDNFNKLDVLAIDDLVSKDFSERKYKVILKKITLEN